jgi:hypothetical protein
VKNLYIKKDDQLLYLENEVERSLKGMEKLEAGSTELFVTQLKSINVFHMYFNTIGLTPRIEELSEAIVNSVMETFKQLRFFRVVIQNYPVEYDGTASKSLLTAYITEAMARGKKWDSGMLRRKMIMAAILQDIALPDEGMTHITKLNDERLKIYHKDAIEKFTEHPIKAGEIARQFSKYPDLDFLIENHHELPNKEGFPNQPSNSKFTVMSSMFNIAQYMAAHLDGQMITEESIPTLLRSMISDF